MSDSDLTKITRLEEQMKNLDKRMDEGFADIKTDFNRIEKTMQDFIIRSDEKFASKWVESGAKWMMIAVGGIVLSAVIELVIKR